MVVEQLGLTLLVLICIAFAVGIANVSLLIGLLHIYWKTYKEVKSRFTIGLLYFASILLLQNILVTIALAIPLIIMLLPFPITQSDLTEPHYLFFVINLIQLVALTILYKITKE
jgi:hypothetical protein